MEVFGERLEITSTPLKTRIGKPEAGKKRLILVKIKTFEEESKE